MSQYANVSTAPGPDLGPDSDKDRLCQHHTTIEYIECVPGRMPTASKIYSHGQGYNVVSRHKAEASS